MDSIIMNYIEEKLTDNLKKDFVVAAIHFIDEEELCSEEDIKKKVGGEPSDYYEFASWSPSLDEPIKTTTFFYAQYVFNGYIEDKNGDGS